MDQITEFFHTLAWWVLGISLAFIAVGVGMVKGRIPHGGVVISNLLVFEHLFIWGSAGFLISLLYLML